MFGEFYKETFSQVTTPDEIIQEVLNLKNKRRKRIRIPTLVAAMLLVCVLATTAFAYTGFVVYDNPQKMLEAFFGSGNNPSSDDNIHVNDAGQEIKTVFQREELNQEAAEKYVAPYIFEVGKSITYAGSTLTVDAASYDPNTQCGMVYVHFENPNGIPDYYLQATGELTWNSLDAIQSNMLNITYFLDKSQSTDTNLSLAGYFYKGDYMKEANLSLYMGDLDGTVTENITIPLEGVPPMAHITLGNGGIQLSPIGLVIHGDKLNLLDGTETRVHSVKVCYTDGSEYIVANNTDDAPIMNFACSIIEPGDGYETNRRCVTYLLNRIVPLQEVTEVFVNGISYSVDPEPIDAAVVSGSESGATDEGIYTIDPAFTIHANNDPVIGQPLVFTEGLSSGKLIYSVTGAEIIHRIQDIPVDIFDCEVVPQSILDDFSGKRIYRWSWLEQEQREKINEKDGTFKDNLCLVFVYITAETLDASGNTFGDSCWFKANRLMLVDSNNPEFAVPVSYFSEAWGDLGPEGNPVLSMLPNETNYVAFGFLVNKYNSDGTPVDFSSFCVRGTEGETESTLIPLGLLE